MAVLAKKFNIQKTGASAVACKIYSTTTEAGSNYMYTNVDGAKGYVPLTTTTNNNTSGRVSRNGTTYIIQSNAKPPYTKNSYTTPGTYTFTVPTDVTKVILTIAGGGGGGAGTDSYTYSYKVSGGCKNSYSYTAYATAYNAGAKGGNGGLYTGTVSVTTGATYTITVGAGGAGGAGNDAVGGTGGKSSFGSLASANGGTGGNQTTAGTAGTPNGAGGAGGAGAAASNGSNGSAGGNGWVYVEFGGDI